MLHPGTTPLKEDARRMLEQRVGGGGYAHADDDVRAGLAALERKGGMRECDLPLDGEKALAEWRRMGAL